MSLFRWSIGACLLLVSCSHTTAPAPAITSVTVPAGVTPTMHELPPTGRAHGLVILAASCWLGGLWSDASGERGDLREIGIRLRCEELLRELAVSAPGTYYPLRAVDSATVDRLANRIHRVAIDDARDRPHADELVAFFEVVADASRETVRARRAADTVKEGFQSFGMTERRAHKIDAAKELQDGTALRALLQHRGPYGLEAHVLGLLHALDRMEIASGLPKHLKIYAVESPFNDVFGVPAPSLTGTPDAPIPSGTWLAYLTAVASAAGHPVPPDARDPQNREPLAWNGVLAGFADRLREVRTGTSIDGVAQEIVSRLDQQEANLRAAFEAHGPSER
jgi:hypothetical protein